MDDVIIKIGALPYDDGSGFEINIAIEAPNKHFDYNRLILNPGSEFTDFDVKKWPEVRSAIDRAVSALNSLSPMEPGDG